MIYLKFTDLPKNIQEELLSRIRGEGNGFAFKTSEIFLQYFIILASIAWFVLLFYLANDFLWGKFRLFLFSLISVVASYFLVHGFDKLYRWFTSRPKSYLLITPLFIIDIDFDDVRYWNLEQLLTVNSVHRYQNGRYKFTQINLILEGGSKTVKIKDIETAEQTVEQINHFRKLYIEAAARNDAAYLDSNNDFIELDGQINESGDGFRTKNLQRILTLSTSAIFAAGIIYGAISLNNYYDDKKSWDIARSVNRASNYRSYLQTHPNGRWKNDANVNLQTLYDTAEQEYQASLNKDYEQKAVDAILQVLRYAKTTQNYQVKVIFERYNEIPENIVEELKKEFEVTKILSLGDTFSDEKMSRRETDLLTVIADAFKYIIPDDILEITNECSGECMVFLVNYKVSSKDSLYYDTRQNNIAENDRIFYPGIFINWDFGIQTPNQTAIYNFTLSSVPAEEIYYDSNSDDEINPNKDFTDVLNADKSNIYDSMVLSAFDDFKTNLVFRMGIGAAPKNLDEKTQKPDALPTASKEKSKSVK